MVDRTSSWGFINQQASLRGTQHLVAILYKIPCNTYHEISRGRWISFFFLNSLYPAKVWFRKAVAFSLIMHLWVGLSRQWTSCWLVLCHFLSVQTCWAQMILYWQNSRDPTWASHAYELLETLLTFPVHRHGKTWIEKVSYCLADQATSSTCSLGDRKSPDSRRATLCVLWLKKILVMCIWYYMIVYVHLGQNLLYSPWSSISSWKFEKNKSLLMGWWP